MIDNVTTKLPSGLVVFSSGPQRAQNELCTVFSFKKHQLWYLSHLQSSIVASVRPINRRSPAFQLKTWCLDTKACLLKILESKAKEEWLLLSLPREIQV